MYQLKEGETMLNIDKEKDYIIENIKKILKKVKIIEGKYAYQEQLKEQEKIILVTNDNYLLFLFAKDIPGADVKKLGEAIMKNGDPLYNYYFAKWVPNADTKGHKEVVIQSGNPEYNFWFPIGIEKSDIKRHQEAILKSGNPEYNYLFAKNMNLLKEDIRRHEDVVILSRDTKSILLFAKDVKDANKEKLYNVLSELDYLKNFNTTVINFNDNNETVADETKKIIK